MRYNVVGMGWWELLEEYESKLKVLGVYDMYPLRRKGLIKLSFRYGTTDPDKIDKINKLVEELKEKSSIICEECGSYGTQRKIVDRTYTLCDDCRIKIIIRKGAGYLL